MENRQDGRNYKLRPQKLKFGVLPRANGSAEFTSGYTSVVASINGPSQPLFGRQLVIEGVSLDISWSGFSQEIPMLEFKLRSALKSIIDKDKLRGLLICIVVALGNDDGSVDSCCVNAVIAALYDAGVPLILDPSDPIFFVSKSMILIEGESVVVYDTNKVEEELCLTTEMDVESNCREELRECIESVCVSSGAKSVGAAVYREAMLDRPKVMRTTYEHILGVEAIKEEGVKQETETKKEGVKEIKEECVKEEE